jgi:hypothetical protein
MSVEKTFSGEIEFDPHTLPSIDFGEFQYLPYSDDIHDLAKEFSNSLELMPYQKVGEHVKLLISVYLQLKQKPGTIIAVLIREKYPKDLTELANLVHLAHNIFNNMTQLNENFDKISIDSANSSLDHLHNKILAKLA